MESKIIDYDNFLWNSYIHKYTHCFFSKTYINKVLISETQRFLITVRKVLKDGFEPNVFNITSGKYIQLFQKRFS